MVEFGVSHAVAVLKSLGCAVYFVFEGVQENIGEGWARVVSLQEVPELLVEESKHAGPSSGTCV